MIFRDVWFSYFFFSFLFNTIKMKEKISIASLRFACLWPELSYQLPFTDQITEIAPDVRTYSELPSIVSTMV